MSTAEISTEEARLFFSTTDYQMTVQMGKVEFVLEAKEAYDYNFDVADLLGRRSDGDIYFKRVFYAKNTTDVDVFASVLFALRVCGESKDYTEATKIALLYLANRIGEGLTKTNAVQTSVRNLLLRMTPVDRDGAGGPEPESTAKRARTA